ncbi:MAG TPA: hypothetical protein VM509_14030 [Planctomycetota bacterium]|nr:hypothetical protein [Planctomycetota bacterium]
MRKSIQDESSSKTAIQSEASRRLRSLCLSWHDEESGDELAVDVQGSERFLEGLRPLGFLPAATRLGGLRASPSPRQAPAEHRVHWTVRLVRHWNPERH